MNNLKKGKLVRDELNFKITLFHKKHAQKKNIFFIHSFYTWYRVF